MMLTESSNYTCSCFITDDGTETGNIVGNMNASIDTANQLISISASLYQGAVVDATTVQKQFTSFISTIRAKAAEAGLTAFAE